MSALASIVTAFEGQLASVLVQVRSLQDLFEELKQQLPQGSRMPIPDEVLTAVTASVTASAEEAFVLISTPPPTTASATTVAVATAPKSKPVTKVKTTKSLALEDPFLLPVDIEPVVVAVVRAPATAAPAVPAAPAASAVPAAATATAAVPKPVAAPTTIASLLAAAAAKAPAASKVAKVTLPVNATDSLKDHKYRLQTLDPLYCRGRKVNEKMPIPGTAPSDADSNGQVYAELQCPKKVKKGELLCEACKEKDDEHKADPTKYAKRWWGRLDEPMYPRAMVVGCHHSFEKYPYGIPGDSTTAAPEAWLGANPAIVKKYKAKTKTVEKKAVATVAAAAAAAAVAAAPAAVGGAGAPPEVVAALIAAATTAGPSADESWGPYLHECRLHVYEKATGKCYLAKTDDSYATYEEMKDADQYMGRYDAATDTLDPYGEEDD